MTNLGGGVGRKSMNRQCSYPNTVLQLAHLVKNRNRRYNEANFWPNCRSVNDQYLKSLVLSMRSHMTIRTIVLFSFVSLTCSILCFSPAS